MDLKSSRSEDLVKIQSLLPSIQLGELDKPIWIPSKSGIFNVYFAGIQLRVETIFILNVVLLNALRIILMRKCM